MKRRTNGGAPRLKPVPGPVERKAVDIELGFSPGEVKVKFSHPVPDLIMTAEAALNLARGLAAAAKSATAARDSKLAQLKKELGVEFVEGLLTPPKTPVTPS